MLRALAKVKLTIDTIKLLTVNEDDMDLLGPVVKEYRVTTTETKTQIQFIKIDESRVKYMDKLHNISFELTNDMIVSASTNITETKLNGAVQLIPE